MSKLDGNPAGGETKKSRNSNKDISQESDSFYKYYNKEIKVNQDEIPIVLYELADAAYNYIQRESYDKALVLLQKTEGVLEVINLEQSKRDKYIAFATYHNMAMCYQKMGYLEECLMYLKECIKLIHVSNFYKENTVASRMKQLKQECKLKLQLCAILSQTQNHSEALDNSKKSVKLVHQLFKDLMGLCSMYVNKIDKRSKKNIQEQDDRLHQISVLSTSPSQYQHGPTSFLEDSISMLERTSMKIYPVVKEVLKRMIEESSALQQEKNCPEGEELEKDQKKLQQSPQESDLAKLLLQQDANDQQADMRSVLGFLNQNEWIYNLNIGNIMQIQPLQVKDLLQSSRNEIELSRDAFLEKISLLSVGYFCVSTEMRFILQSREQYLSSPVKRQRELESEYWHAKALEIACTFLPSECPLLNHVLLSYQKHHDPSQHPIREDQAQMDILSVLRPLNGIESNKYQPIIRQLGENMGVKVQISPCPMSPLTRRVFRNQQQYNNQNQKKNQIGSKSQNPEQNEELKTDYGLLVSPEIDNIQAVFVNLQDQPSNVNLHQQQMEYSDDYYDQFVKRLIDDPQLDKKQIVTKLMSHLQSQDFSQFQRQINEQQEQVIDQGYIEQPSEFVLKKQHSNNSEEMFGNNQSFDILQTMQKNTKILEDNQEEFPHLWSQQQQSKKTQAKKREANRVKKLMSYIEGDSLLKEIEKSLEQEGHNDNDDEEYDEKMVSRVVIKQNESGRDEEDVDGFIKAIGYDDDVENEEDSRSNNGPIGGLDTEQDQSKNFLFSLQEANISQIKKQESINEKSNCITRPSSSITNHTSQSKLRRKRSNATNNNQKNINQNHFKSNQLPCKGSFSRSTSSSKSMSHKKSKGKIDKQLINNFLTQGGISNGKILPAQTNQQKSLQKQKEIKPQQQSAQIKSKSKSRIANQSVIETKIPKSKIPKQQVQKRMSFLFNTKEKKSALKQNRGYSSSSGGNTSSSATKRRFNGNQSRSRLRKDKSLEANGKMSEQLLKDISINTCGQSQGYVGIAPQLLTQPSDLINHSNSIDISLIGGALPNSQKNFKKQLNEQSITNLQQQVLENQRLLQMYKLNNSETKLKQKSIKYGNLRQSDLLQQLFTMDRQGNQQNGINQLQLFAQQNINSSIPQKRSSQIRSKSTALGKNKLYQQSIDQTISKKGLPKKYYDNDVNGNEQKISKSNQKLNNKENIVQASLNKVLSTNNKRQKRNKDASAVNKSVVFNTKFYNDKMDNCKRNFDQANIKFLDQNSPELRKKNKNISQSPKQKRPNSKQKQRKSQNSKIIFSTADNRNCLTRHRKSNNGLDVLTTHEDSLWGPLPHEQSFDALIRNSLGGFGQQSDGDLLFQNNQRSQQMLAELRQSFGQANIQRGSSEMAFVNGLHLSQKPVTTFAQSQSQNDIEVSSFLGGNKINLQQLKVQIPVSKTQPHRNSLINQHIEVKNRNSIGANQDFAKNQQVHQKIQENSSNANTKQSQLIEQLHKKLLRI